MIPFWYEIVMFTMIYIYEGCMVCICEHKSQYTNFRTEWKMETYYLMFSMCIDNDLSFENVGSI